MADRYTPEGGKPEELAAARLDQAAMLFEEIATLALRTERECSRTHGGIVGVEDPNPQSAEDELARLRDVISRLGWLADLGCSRIVGSESIKGGAEAWLLPPILQRPAIESAAG